MQKIIELENLKAEYNRLQSKTLTGQAWNSPAHSQRLKTLSLRISQLTIELGV